MVMMDNPGPSFIQDILDETERQGVNRKEMARRLGVSQPSITIFFKAKNLTLGTMTKIAEAIGCTYEIRLITPSSMEGDSSR